MGRRYTGYAVAGDVLAGVRGIPFGLAAVALGLLAAGVIDAGALDSLTAGRIAGVVSVHVGVVVLVGGWELWQLVRLMRRAEPADDVTVPKEDEQRRVPQWIVDVLAPLTLGGAIAIACLVEDDAAVFVVGSAAVALGSALAVVLPKLLIRRHERRVGRRYFRTSGEPEKVVWLPTNPFAIGS